MSYGLALSMRVLPLPVALWPEQNNATPSLQPHYRTFITVGSEEARSIALALASVRRSNWACSFPAPSFHEDAVRRVASEGIIATKFTSPYSP